MLTESEFRKLADAELKALAQKLDPIDGLSADGTADALTIEFDDGERFVLNQQGPTRQIWFAASFEAAHFSYDGQNWLDAKTGEALRARISRDVSRKVGAAVAL